jgi:hypothetical protein
MEQKRLATNNTNRHEWEERMGSTADFADGAD